VTAPTLSAVAGQPLPALTPTIGGFANGQSLATSGVIGSAVCTTTATASSPAGTYPITCTQGSLAATNYRFASFTAGTLTITPAASTCSSPWPQLPSPYDKLVQKLHCERLLSSPSPSSPATVGSGQDLTIVYSDETPLGAGLLCPVAVLSTGKVLPVRVKSLPASSGYKSQLTVDLPDSLGPGTYSVYLVVPDGDGDVDFWTWTVTVAAPPPPLLFSACFDDGKAYPGDDLSIVYAADTKIGTGSLAPTARLSTGHSLAVTVGSAPSGGDSSWRSKRYRNTLTVKLPSSLATGTYSVLLTVHDTAGNTDSFTWHVTVARHK